MSLVPLLEPVAIVFRRPALRRLILTFALFRTAEMGSWITVTTLAFSFGGVDEAGAVVVAQLAPAAVAALWVHRLSARWSDRRVQVGGLIVQSFALLAAGLLTAVDAPHLWIYAAAIVAAVSVVTTRPTLTALLGGVVDDPRQLTAANAVLGAVDGSALLVGPMLAAVALAVGGAALSFVVFAVLTAVAATVSSLVRVEARVGVYGGSEGKGSGSGDELPSHSADDRARPPSGVWAVLGVLAAHSFLIGSLDLLYVVIAVDVTGGTAVRAALLSTAFGVGALVGGGATILLVGRTYLWPAIAFGGVLTTATLVLVSMATGVSGSALALVACGAVSAILFVAARTLLQRLCDLATLCRAFSMAESCEMAMLLTGAIAVPLMVRTLGASAAPIGVALIVALIVMVSIRPMLRAEQSVVGTVDRIELLRAVRLFASLPAPTLETLARESTDHTVADGVTVITEGEPGDRFYVVTAGHLVVLRGGEAVNQLGPGDGFGELALINDAPRSASVRSLGEVEMLSIERHPFLVAVTGTLPPGSA